MKTTTSDPHLLPEIFDYIIDFLRDDTKTLKQCCLVSKSWLPRSREHIFADLTLDEEDDLESWRETFSDPANSPSYHTRNLTIRCDPGHMEESGWVQSFPRLETLCMMSEDGWVNFPMFQKLAPSITALALCSLYLPHLQILDLICSLPLLEDLILIGEVNEAKGSNGPPAVVSTSPPLNNHLDILLSEGFARTLSGLLSLPGGLRFRAVDLAWCREPDDLLQVRELVGACSGTLESFRIGSRVSDDGTPGPIDLSKATNLRDVEFQCITGLTGCMWIIMTLGTIKSEHRDLREITICFMEDDDYDYDTLDLTELNEAAKPGMRWSDLDSLLILLLELRSIRPRILCPQSDVTQGMVSLAGLARSMLPETARRGIVELYGDF